MKIEIDIPDELMNKQLVICDYKEPTSYVYLNVFQKGDVWLKIKGCEGCSWEDRKKCCGKCPMNTEKGCFFHLDSGTSNKPQSCVVRPNPNASISSCQLEFKCIKGINDGKIIKINTPNFEITRN